MGSGQKRGLGAGAGDRPRQETDTHRILVILLWTYTWLDCYARRHRVMKFSNHPLIWFSQKHL